MPTIAVKADYALFADPGAVKAAGALFDDGDTDHLKIPLAPLEDSMFPFLAHMLDHEALDDNNVPTDIEMYSRLTAGTGTLISGVFLGKVTGDITTFNITGFIITFLVFGGNTRVQILRIDAGGQPETLEYASQQDTGTWIAAVVGDETPTSIFKHNFYCEDLLDGTFQLAYYVNDRLIFNVISTLLSWQGTPAAPVFGASAMNTNGATDLGAGDFHDFDALTWDAATLPADPEAELVVSPWPLETTFAAVDEW